MESVYKVAQEGMGCAQCVSCDGDFEKEDGRYGFELATGVVDEGGV